MSSRGGGGRSSSSRRGTSASASTPTSSPTWQVQRGAANVAETIAALFPGRRGGGGGGTLTDEQLARLAGAPAGARVRVFAGPEHDMLHFNVSTPDGSYYSTRTLARSAKDGRLEIQWHNAAVTRADLRGQGLATRLLGSTIKQAGQLGVARIGAREMARDDQPDESGGAHATGYKVWPRLGFNGVIPAHLRASLPAELRGVRSLLDLYATDVGRRWWAEHGTTTRGVFTVRAGSRSRRMLDAALAFRGIKWEDL